MCDEQVVFLFLAIDGPGDVLSQVDFLVLVLHHKKPHAALLTQAKQKLVLQQLAIAALVNKTILGTFQYIALYIYLLACCMEDDQAVKSQK